MNIKTFLAGAFVLTSFAGAEAKDITIFDAVTFYDGYRVANFPEDAELVDSILYHRTSLYAVKLTEEQLDAIGENIRADISIEACCDNYDRIGNINLAMVEKGSESYELAETPRMELGRFITPFMNMNVEPNVVPYTFDFDYLSPILRDRNLREKYDFWVEFELFGVPYAANQQIAGCAGRNDVFKGTLVFVTNDEPAPLTDDNVVVPVIVKNPEYIMGNLNNYQNGANDELGKTERTYTFEVPEDVNEGQIVLITSNHGANENGEEYNRRWHYVDWDGELALTYKPGRKSCEPFRKYNTQSNGIYGWVQKSDAVWQSFSNWCPGDVIDIRHIVLGPVEAGSHSVKIRVPDAVFNGKQGDIPVSMFFQGSKSGNVHALIESIETTEMASVALSGDLLSAAAADGCEIERMDLYDAAGRRVRCVPADKSINVAGLPSGIYLLNIELDNGLTETHKLTL